MLLYQHYVYCILPEGQFSDVKVIESLVWIEGWVKQSLLLDKFVDDLWTMKTANLLWKIIFQDSKLFINKCSQKIVSGSIKVNLFLKSICTMWL